MQQSSVRKRDLFLTPTEAADRLLVAPVTVRLWASKGLLPSVTTPGGHRRFHVRDVEEFAARQSQAHGGQRGAPSRLLIIDDDEQYCRFLTKVLQGRAPALAVEVALDGFMAGILCQSFRPDVVTLDLQMPDIDGFDVCVKLRRLFAKDVLRIVALTAFASPDNARRIVAAGADECVPKTVASEELLRRLGLVHEHVR